MVVTADVHLPTDEELTVTEVNLSGPALRAGAFHMGKFCEYQNNVTACSFPDKQHGCLHDLNALYNNSITITSTCVFAFQDYMLCKDELGDPRKCLDEGKAVTNCALEFFRKVKKTCTDEFAQYANCLDKSSGDLHFKQ